MHQEFTVGDSIVVCCHPGAGHTTHGAAWRNWERGNTGPLRVVSGEKPLPSGLTITLGQVQELLRAAQNPLRGISVVRAGQEQSVGEASVEKSRAFAAERRIRELEAEVTKLKVDLEKSQEGLAAAEGRVEELEALSKEFIADNERLTKELHKAKERAGGPKAPARAESKAEDRGAELPLEGQGKKGG
jgi:hypothetical protein